MSRLRRERLPSESRRLRLWAGFGNWERSAVKDIEIDSPRSRIYKECKALFGWKGNRKMTERMQIVETSYQQSLLR